MLNLTKIISFKNLADLTYRNILFYSILAGVAMQTFLLSSIDYLALEIKHSDKVFYNYATIATLAATLPQALSLIISYLVNNLHFRKLLILGFSIIWISGVIIIFVKHNFLAYVTWIIVCGIIFNAIFLNLSRQMIRLLNERIKDYQSDSFLLGALGNMLGYQLGSLGYNHLHLNGIIIIFLISCLLMFFIIFRVKFDTSIEKAEHNLINPKSALTTLLKQHNLLIFIVFILSIILVGSGLNMFILAKIHQLQLKNHVYANLWSCSAAGGIIGALMIKNPWVQQKDNFKSLTAANLLIIVAYLGVGNSQSQILLELVMGIFGFANTVFLINMNTICFSFINRDKNLLAIAPLINGFMMTGFYTVSLVGPLIYNVLLQHNISVTAIVNLVAIVEIGIMAICYNLIRKCTQ